MPLPAKFVTRHYLFLLGGSLLLIALLALTRPQKPAQLRAAIEPVVSAVSVVHADVRPTLRVSGRLQPRRQAVLSAEVAAQVVARPSEPGQILAAGETLLQLDDGDYQSALKRAEAQLLQEQAAVARDKKLLQLASENRRLQNRELQRLENLKSQSLTSASRLGEVRQRLLQLQAEEAQLDYAVRTTEQRLALKQAEQERAARDVARCRIVAPFAGVVNSLKVDVGARVTPGQEVATLVDAAYVDLYAEIPGDAPLALTLGQRLPVTLSGSRQEGTLVALQREPSRDTHTLALRIRLAGEGLVSGAIGEVTLPMRPLHQVLQVPAAALLREDGHSYLFVLDGELRLSRREVTTGVRHGEQVVVMEGLTPGERVVMRDVAALSDGQQVRLSED